MKKLLTILLGSLVSLTSCECEKDNSVGGDPLYYFHYMQILDPEGGDPFKDWTEEELGAIRHKTISITNGHIVETPWRPIKIIRNDTITLFFKRGLPDTTYIHFPKTDRTDTIVHKREKAYDKCGNLTSIKVSKFYFNGELEAVLDFESDPDLLMHLYETNQDSLIKETYVMKFKRED